jgi:hypothetical protein
MANDKIRKNYKDIANAIRSKTGENSLISAEEMPQKISEIETGIEPAGTKEIISNGEFNIRDFEKVDVNVPNPSVGNKQITTTEQVNVTEFATAQVVDVNLVAGNIKKDVTILGILGTLEGGSGDLDELMQETF